MGRRLKQMEVPEKMGETKVNLRESLDVANRGLVYECSCGQRVAVEEKNTGIARLQLASGSFLSFACPSCGRETSIRSQIEVPSCSVSLVVAKSTTEWDED